MPYQALISLWLRPRAAFSAVMQRKPTNSSVGLYILAMYITLLDYWLTKNVPSLLMSIAIVVVPIVSVLVLYLQGAILGVVSRWFDGQADALACRTALSWGGVPVTVGAIFGVVGYLVYGQEMLWLERNSTPLHGMVYVISVVSTVLTFYTFFTTSIMLGEANGFSAWRGLAVMLVTLLLIFVVMLVLVMLGAAVYVLAHL
ncbi:YIP1 family protein [Gallaecimonas mangrovi]|uniref:YIP1 family protein n=1 Tax=Gallaecimonas mangrovi TaxID=2291597 RepID=UPI000E203134|nr:YIP1 family protein [Gallaecimonas mangrovi]